MLRESASKTIDQLKWLVDATMIFSALFWAFDVSAGREKSEGKAKSQSQTALYLPTPQRNLASVGSKESKKRERSFTSFSQLSSLNKSQGLKTYQIKMSSMGGTEMQIAPSYKDNPYYVPPTVDIFPRF
jgi:hypothetical protein